MASVTGYTQLAAGDSLYRSPPNFWLKGTRLPTINTSSSRNSSETLARNRPSPMHMLKPLSLQHHGKSVSAQLQHIGSGNLSDPQTRRRHRSCIDHLIRTTQIPTPISCHARSKTWPNQSHMDRAPLHLKQNYMLTLGTNDNMTLSSKRGSVSDSAPIKGPLPYYAITPMPTGRQRSCFAHGAQRSPWLASNSTIPIP